MRHPSFFPAYSFPVHFLLPGLSLFKYTISQISALIQTVTLTTPLQLALFIMAWAALWTFVSAFLYTSGAATELEFRRQYLVQPDDNVANITMVYFKDSLMILALIKGHLKVHMT